MPNHYITKEQLDAFNCITDDAQTICTNSLTGSKVNFTEYITIYTGYNAIVNPDPSPEDGFDWVECTGYFVLGASLYIALFVIYKKVFLVLQFLRKG